MTKLTIQDRDGNCQTRRFREARKARDWLQDMAGNAAMRLAAVTHDDGEICMYSKPGAIWEQVVRVIGEHVKPKQVI